MSGSHDHSLKTHIAVLKTVHCGSRHCMGAKLQLGCSHEWLRLAMAVCPPPHPLSPASLSLAAPLQLYNLILIQIVSTFPIKLQPPGKPKLQSSFSEVTVRHEDDMSPCVGSIRCSQTGLTCTSMSRPSLSSLLEPPFSYSFWRLWEPRTSPHLLFLP